MFNFTKLKPLLFFNKNLYQHKSVELRKIGRMLRADNCYFKDIIIKLYSEVLLVFLNLRYHSF
jgi:hypothetical protein